jgi:hypothetical protein
MKDEAREIWWTLLRTGTQRSIFANGICKQSPNYFLDGFGRAMVLAAGSQR